MDEILEKLGTAIINTNTDDDEYNRSYYEDLYKNWGKLGNQQQRRKDLIDTQRSNRNSILDKVRGILELVDAEEDEIFKHQKQYMYRPNIYVAGFTKSSPTYKNVLMMSEWMIEKPEDFHEMWLVVPCPKGVRTLVVASQGTTKCYSKYGHFRFECRTALPGGGPFPPGCKNRCCVLDCFHVETSNTMYILDLLAWNSLPMTDGEAEFRHYWLQTQLAEVPETNLLSKINKLIFKILPKVHCRRESFDEFMMQMPHFENFSPGLDGLLFYHKRAHYFAGQTPVVGWLYPFMVPEVIGSDVKINPGYMLERPMDYVCQADFIQKFEERNSKKKKNVNNAMDTTPPVPQAGKKAMKKTRTLTQSMEADVTQETPESKNEEPTETKFVEETVTME